jgi:hypothetical protein
MFRRNISPPPSVSKSNQCKKLSEAEAICSSEMSGYSELHRFTTQKAAPATVTVVKNTKFNKRLLNLSFYLR